MNNHNVIINEEKDKYVTAEWADRAPDDDDRYADDSIIISVTVPPKDPDNPKDDPVKRAKAALARKYDEWMRERNG